MEIYIWIAAAIVGSIIGYLLGAIRGNGHVGLLLGFLLGPLGWLIVVAMNIAKKKDSPALTQYIAARPYPATAPFMAPEPRVKKIRIQRDGKVIGSWTTDEVTGYLETGELTWDDLYFDGAKGDWAKLAGNPDV